MPDTNLDFHGQYVKDDDQLAYAVYVSADSEMGTVSNAGDSMGIWNGQGNIAGSEAQPKDGCRFVGWYKGDTLITTQAKLDGNAVRNNMDKNERGMYLDTTFTARFETALTSYTVYYYLLGTNIPVAK